MKILHISNNDSSGAGLCAYRLHKSLQQEGIDSKMIVLKKTQDDDSVTTVFQKRLSLYRFFHALLRSLNIYLFEYDKLIRLSHEHHVPFTRPVTPFDLSPNSLVKEADIIHLHWVDDFFDQAKFLQTVRKPIIWTLHDEGMFYGVSHYHDIILYDNPIEKKYREIKLTMSQNAHSLHFVLLSKYFKKAFGSAEILKGHGIHVIGNSVDYTKFEALNKIDVRRQLGLDQDAIYLSFLAANIADSHKGLTTLIDSLSILSDGRIKIIAIGNNQQFTPNEKVITTGIIRDPKIISQYLSASDYFCMPSLQEAFSQAPIEAMACGKPAIVTPVSGTEDLITEENGIITTDFSAQSIADAIHTAMNRAYNPDTIRKDVIERFSPSVITGKYIEIYESILKD